MFMLYGVPKRHAVFRSFVCYNFIYSMEIDHFGEKALHLIKTKKSAFWEAERDRRSLFLFHEAARRVPAYKDFLRKHRIDHEKVKTFKDFQVVPPVNKKNYLRQYPPEKLLWDGALKNPLVWTATSGSTGEPFYFPRRRALDEQYSVIVENYLRSSSHGMESPTLVIVGFGMGVWIGGLITYKAFEIAAERLNQPISIITPGINKPEIFNALRKLAPRFKQTVLIGYPPFVKDILDEAAEQRINIRNLNLRLFFAAEAFTESFRDHLVLKGNIKSPYRDTLNIYGTADIGAMAFESPLSIMIRRNSLKDERLFEMIFSKIGKTPTLAQYDPTFVSFEAVNEEILLTGDNALPLIRYAVGDNGGVISMRDMVRRCAIYDFNLIREARKLNLPTSELPFVYVYERSDFSTKLYGAIIYPEHIKEGLGHLSLQPFITGKFSMMTRFDEQHNEYLEVNIEMKRGIQASGQLAKRVQAAVIESLLKRNAEYHNNYRSIPHRMTPKIKLWKHEDAHYFKPGIKQKWVVKNK